MISNTQLLNMEVGSFTSPFHSFGHEQMKVRTTWLALKLALLIVLQIVGSLPFPFPSYVGWPSTSGVLILVHFLWFSFLFYLVSAAVFSQASAICPLSLFCPYYFLFRSFHVFILCMRISTIHSMFLNPSPTVLFFLIASKVNSHCAAGLLGLGFSSSSFSHVSPFLHHHVAFSACPPFPCIFFSSYFIEAVFLEYLKSDTPIQLHVAYGCFWAMATVRIVVTETVWPTKPKIFTVWHFAKKFCRSLAWRDSWIPIPAPSWMAGEYLQLLLHFLVPTGLFSQFASALWRWWSSVSTARLSHSLHQWFR